MTELKLKIYPAFNGDCFLLKLGKNHILIDGGYVNTFDEYLSKDLKRIAKDGGSLSHVIVTHIDQDHISGIVKLFENNRQSKLISIKNVWHNSFRHIQSKISSTSLERPKDELLDEIAGSSYLKEINKEEKPISAEQGSSLASLVLEGKYSWNEEFDGNAVSTDTHTSISIDDEIKFLLLSPDNEKLQKLEKTWRKELKKKGYLEELKEGEYYDDAFEFMIAKLKEPKRMKENNISSGAPKIEELIKIPFEEDNTSPNGSSIAFIIEYRKKKLLFLGDSHPSLITKNLRALYDEKDFPIQFDVIKTSHHGSWSNNSPDLLELVDSTRFIFSTNGKGHNHPDQETIAHIISRETDEQRKLYINYPSEGFKKFDNDVLKKKHNYEMQHGDGKSVLEINLFDE
jgi:beta-lactamase superfamily II metal-dependent hydrolase